jgi:penicillin-binding protein 1A
MPERSSTARLAMLAGIWFLISVLTIIPLAVIGANAATSLLEMPTNATLPASRLMDQSSRILDARGRLITMLHGEEHRIMVTPDKIPDVVREAVIAVEDERFYEHRGVDAAAIVRSFMSNVSAKETVQGGSTITQQYVRNAYEEVGREPTVTRKIKEAVMAMRLERELDKDEILHRYLNTVYFGRGAYGIEAAAKEFFGKPALKLTLPEAATLAAVIRGPQLYESDAKARQERRNYVLRRMREAGFISAGAEAAAVKTPIRLARPSGPSSTAAYFVEYIRRQLITPVAEGGLGLTSKQVLGGGLTIYTTLDLDLQNAAERAVASVLDRAEDPEAGFVAMTTSGEVRAMVGGRNFTSLTRARGFNFAAQTARGQGRPAGSTFKVFTLAAYLEAGLSPRKTYRAPSHIRIPDRMCSGPDGDWDPGNYGRKGYGSMNVIRATEQSVNTVYAQMIEDVGPSAALRMAQRAGIESPMQPVCSITLGVFGVTPLEMARAYSTFAARGERPNVVTVTKVVAPNGKTVLQRKPETERAVKTETADAVNAILERVVKNGTGRPAATIRTAAGKTGTTDDFRDVWFVGYTPHPGMSAAVWIGYPPDANGKIRQMTNVHGRRATGGGLAGLIWKRFMDTALAGAANTDFASSSLSGDPDRNTGRGRLYRVSQSEVIIPGTFTRTDDRRNGRRRRRR